VCPALRASFSVLVEHENWRAATSAAFSAILSRHAYCQENGSTPSHFTPFPSCPRRMSTLFTGWLTLDQQGDKQSLLFGPPGGRQSHLRLCHRDALIENGYRVLFTRTNDLVQKLQQAIYAISRSESAIAKLDPKFDLRLILDGLCLCPQRIRPRPAVLLRTESAPDIATAIHAVTAKNQPFGAWDTIFRNRL